MRGIPRYLSRRPGLVPMMDQASTGNAEGCFQLGVIAQGGLAAQPRRVQQMGIQLADQVPAIGEELRRFEVTMLAIAFLMQALHGLERVTQPAHVVFHDQSTDAKPG